MVQKIKLRYISFKHSSIHWYPQNSFSTTLSQTPAMVGLLHPWLDAPGPKWIKTVDGSAVCGQAFRKPCLEYHGITWKFVKIRLAQLATHVLSHRWLNWIAGFQNWHNWERATTEATVNCVGMLCVVWWWGFPDITSHTQTVWMIDLL